MTRFEVARSITRAKEFSSLMFALAHDVETPEEFQKNLEMELTDGELQNILSVARHGDYPLSLEGLQ